MTLTDIKQLMNQGTEQAKQLLIQEYIKQVYKEDVDTDNVSIQHYWLPALEWCHKILGTVIVEGRVKKHRLIKQ